MATTSCCCTSSSRRKDCPPSIPPSPSRPSTPWSAAGGCGRWATPRSPSRRRSEAPASACCACRLPASTRRRSRGICFTRVPAWCRAGSPTAATAWSCSGRRACSSSWLTTRCACTTSPNRSSVRTACTRATSRRPPTPPRTRARSTSSWPWPPARRSGSTPRATAAPHRWTLCCCAGREPCAPSPPRSTPASPAPPTPRFWRATSFPAARG